MAKDKCPIERSVATTSPAGLIRGVWAHKEGSHYGRPLNGREVRNQEFAETIAAGLPVRQSAGPNASVHQGSLGRVNRQREVQHATGTRNSPCSPISIWKSRG